MRNVLLPLLLLATTFLVGCGKKGALLPPEALVPASVGDARVAQRGEAFRVSWSAPTREVSGRPLKEGVRYRLSRREVLPPGQDCSTCPDVWKLLGELDPAVPGSVERSNGRLTYLDQAMVPDVTYQYRVQAVTASGGVSSPVLIPPRQRVAPPAPPLLTAKPGGTGVRIDVAFPAPGTSAPPAYLLLRREGTGPVRQLTPTPITATGYDDQDVRTGATYCYTARTVATISGQTIESADSVEAVIAVSLPE